MRALLSVSVLLLLAMPAAAEACCEGWCSELFRIELPPTPVGTYYVVEDNGCQPECMPHMPSLWIYEETNGVAGLQRLDMVADETCSGSIPGDTIVF